MPRWAWRSVTVYLALCVVALIGAGVALAFYFQLHNDGGYFGLVGRLGEVRAARGMLGVAVVLAPFAAVAAALVCVVAAVAASRGRAWAAWLAALAAAVTPFAVYFGVRYLHRVEGRYYAKSHYVRLYRESTFPFAALGVVFLLVLIVGLVRARQLQKLAAS